MVFYHRTNFSTTRCTQQNIKLQSALAASHMSQLRAIKTLVASPGPEPYDTVKFMLTCKFAKSETENLNQLLYTSRLLPDECLLFIYKSCENLWEAAQVTNTIVFCAGFFLITCRQMFAEF